MLNFLSTAVFSPKDKETRQPRGFTFCQYRRKEDAEDAVKGMDKRVNYLLKGVVSLAIVWCALLGVINTFIISMLFNFFISVVLQWSCKICLICLLRNLNILYSARLGVVYMLIWLMHTQERGTPKHCEILLHSPALSKHNN